MAYEAVHELAHRYAGGRWIATGGGGYEIVDVVPRIWTHLLAIAAELRLQTPCHKSGASTSSR